MLRFNPLASVRKFCMISALCAVPACMHAGTIFSEDFSTANPGFGVTTAGQFTAINGTQVDVLGAANGFAFECLGEGGPCVDLAGSAQPDGNPANNGDLVATVTAPAAGVYFLSFVLVGNSIQQSPATTTSVTLGDYANSFSLAFQDTTDGVVSFVPVTLAAGANTITFLNTDSGSLNGSILESVSVVDVVPTPEPATALLLGSVLLVGSLIRKRTTR